MALNFDKLTKLRRDFPKPKFALAEVSRQLKKKKADPYLLAWQIDILLQLGAPRNDSAGTEKSFQEIVNRAPAVTDLQLLSYLYRLQIRVQKREHLGTFHENSGGEVVLGAWKNAALSHSNRKAKYQVWDQLFVNALTEECWEDVRFALNQASQDGFKTDKKTQFTLIFANHMIFQRCLYRAHLHGHNVAPNGLISQRLASTLMNRAFENASKPDKGVVQVEDIRDLNFMYWIFKEQKKGLELAETWRKAPPALRKIIDSQMDEPSLMTELYVQSADWQRAYDVSYTTISKLNHERGEHLRYATHNWRMFFNLLSAYLETHTNLDIPDSTTARQDLLDVLEKWFGDEHTFPKERALQLTKLMFDNNFTWASLLRTCKLFWAENCSLGACFTDLRRFVEQLDRDSQEEFRCFITDTTEAIFPRSFDYDTDPESVDSSSLFDEANPEDMERLQMWYKTEVNVLKFTYCLNLSTPVTPQEPDSFVRDAARLYSIGRDLQDDSFQDVAHLLVMGLLVLNLTMTSSPSSERSANSRYYLQATMLALRLSSGEEGRQNRTLLLLSTMLHLNQGLASIAFEQYRHARIKEMLKDTLSWILLSRISQLHPFETPRFVEPDAELSSTIGTIERMERTVNDTLYTGMKTFYYDQAGELLALKHRLRASATKQLCLVERRRIARLKGERVDESLDLDESLVKRWKDNRDFSALPRFECEGTSPYNYIFTNGKLLQDYGWLIDHYRYRERTSHILYKESTNSIAIEAQAADNRPWPCDRSTAEDCLQRAWEQLNVLSVMIHKEQQAGNAGQAIRQLPKLLKDFGDQMEADMATVMTTLETAGTPSTLPPEDQQIPHSEKLVHLAWGSIEILQLIYRLTHVLEENRKVKGSAFAKYVDLAAIKELRHNTEEWFKDIQQWAENAIDHWKANGLRIIKAQIRYGPTVHGSRSSSTTKISLTTPRNTCGPVWIRCMALHSSGLLISARSPNNL